MTPRTRDRITIAMLCGLCVLLIAYWAYRVLPHRPGPVLGHPPATGTARPKGEATP